MSSTTGKKRKSKSESRQKVHKSSSAAVNNSQRAKPSRHRCGTIRQKSKAKLKQIERHYKKKDAFAAANWQFVDANAYDVVLKWEDSDWQVGVSVKRSASPRRLAAFCSVCPLSVMALAINNAHNTTDLTISDFLLYLAMNLTIRAKSMYKTQVELRHKWHAFFDEFLDVEVLGFNKYSEIRTHALFPIDEFHLYCDVFRASVWGGLAVAGDEKNIKFQPRHGNDSLLTKTNKRNAPTGLWTFEAAVIVQKVDMPFLVAVRQNKQLPKDSTLALHAEFLAEKLWPNIVIVLDNYYLSKDALETYQRGFAGVLIGATEQKMPDVVGPVKSLLKSYGDYSLAHNVKTGAIFTGYKHRNLGRKYTISSAHQLARRNKRISQPKLDELCARRFVLNQDQLDESIKALVEPERRPTPKSSTQAATSATSAPAAGRLAPCGKSGNYCLACPTCNSTLRINTHQHTVERGAPEDAVDLTPPPKRRRRRAAPVIADESSCDSETVLLSEGDSGDDASDLGADSESVDSAAADADNSEMVIDDDERGSGAGDADVEEHEPWPCCLCGDDYWVDVAKGLERTWIQWRCECWSHCKCDTIDIRRQIPDTELVDCPMCDNGSAEVDDVGELVAHAEPAPEQPQATRVCRHCGASTDSKTRVCAACGQMRAMTAGCHPSRMGNIVEPAVFADFHVTFAACDRFNHNVALVDYPYRCTAGQEERASDFLLSAMIVNAHVISEVRRKDNGEPSETAAEFVMELAKEVVNHLRDIENGDYEPKL